MPCACNHSQPPVRRLLAVLMHAKLLFASVVPTIPNTILGLRYSPRRVSDDVIRAALKKSPAFRGRAFLRQGDGPLGAKSSRPIPVFPSAKDFSTRRMRATKFCSEMIVPKTRNLRQSFLPPVAQRLFVAHFVGTKENI